MAISRTKQPIKEAIEQPLMVPKNQWANLPLFQSKAHPAVIKQVVLGYLANARQNTVGTKTRGEVAGSGRKPWRQKGTGRARAGSVRSPLWRGGGVVFGPRPSRRFSVKLPKRLRNQALIAALSARAAQDQVRVVNLIAVKEPKTRLAVDFLHELNLEGSFQLIAHQPSEALHRAFRNLPYVSLANAKDINALAVLRQDYVIIEKAALKDLLNRLNQSRIPEKQSNNER